MTKTVGTKWLGTLLVLIMSVSGAAVGQLSVGTPFGDHMVVQRDQQNPFWGWAGPGSWIEVTFNGLTLTAKSGDDGKWSVLLPRTPAGGPHTLSVVSGSDTLWIRDILAGEVWLASGQSNMSFRLDQTSGADADIPDASSSLLRLCTVPRMRSDTAQATGKAVWEVCTPKVAARFSAVGYYFGDSLARMLKVPVGIIHASWGGTPAESWVPTSVLQGDPMLHPILVRWDEAAATFPEANAAFQRELPQLMEKWRKDSADAVNKGMAPPSRPQAPKGPGHRDSPAGQWNAMINPLVPYGIRGVIWYQGEANASRAYQYRTLFPALIRHWRDAWKEDLPFYYVQLPNLKRRSGSGWPELREAQLMTLSVPHTGMVVSIDVGDSLDLHPRNKKPVGHRLASIALRETYGSGHASGMGPLYAGSIIGNGRIRIRFTCANGGLQLLKTGSTGFVIAGEDSVFHDAQAAVEGQDVVVWSTKVTTPIAVRYAWGENPAWSLLDGSRSPASPFRTDDWPETTYSRR